MEKKRGEYFIWIDNVKGIAIVLVVLNHCGYLAGKENLQWFQHAVPLFLFCSAYLLRKKDIHNYFSKKRLLRLWKRIIGPYLLVEILAVALLLFADIFININIHIDINRFIKSAGLGPGSYFPVVYIQCWLLIPFLVLLKHRYSFSKSLLIFTVLCAILEFFFITISENRVWLWRLLAVRYLMILFVGVYYEEFVKRKALLIALVILSIVVAIIDIYIFPFDNLGWNGYHFYTSFYLLLLIPSVMKLSFDWLALIGKYSYEIFLLQLGYFIIANFMINRGGMFHLGIIILLCSILIAFAEKNSIR